MRCSESVNAARTVAANAGVPMKTRSSARCGAVVFITRSAPCRPSPGLGGCRLSAALRLGELAQDHAAFDQGEMVDEENTVEVFDLMLQAGGEKPRRLHFADLVLVVEIAQPDLGGGRH